MVERPDYRPQAVPAQGYQVQDRAHAAQYIEYEPDVMDESENT